MARVAGDFSRQARCHLAPRPGFAGLGRSQVPSAIRSGPALAADRPWAGDPLARGRSARAVRWPGPAGSPDGFHTVVGRYSHSTTARRGRRRLPRRGSSNRTPRACARESVRIVLFAAALGAGCRCSFGSANGATLARAIRARVLRVKMPLSGLTGIIRHRTKLARARAYWPENPPLAPAARARARRCAKSPLYPQ